MKYVFIWIAVMSVVSFVTLGIAVFIMWDVSYFLLSNWVAQARLVYLAIICLASFFVVFFCVEDHSNQGK